VAMAFMLVTREELRETVYPNSTPVDPGTALCQGRGAGAVFQFAARLYQMGEE
jgi:hypothetical protein